MKLLIIECSIPFYITFKFGDIVNIWAHCPLNLEKNEFKSKYGKKNKKKLKPL